MKNLILYFFWVSAFVMFSSCEEAETVTEYVAIPSTPVGERLVNNTDLIATIYSDSTYTLTDGVDVTEIAYLSTKGHPMRVFVFEVDLSHPSIAIEASLPFGTPSFAMQPMTEQAEERDSPTHMVWGGVNGDFFNTTTGVPRGSYVRNGMVLRSTFDSADRNFFAITYDGKAIMGDASEFSDYRSIIKESVGGRYWLVRDGAVVPQTDTSVHPRTAAGASEDQRTVYLMAVDGRNYTYSNGMTFSELGQCMYALGAHESVNLDGGGSTTFFIRNTPGFTPDRFELRNWPSDRGGEERAVANGLLIIAKDC
jgi:hypothetical protein